MSLWNRGIERSKEVKRSEELAKKRDELMRTFPSIQQAWEKEDSGPVRQAAQELSIVDRMESREKILEAKETLKKAIWTRDGIREGFQRQIDQLNTEIETLADPVIIEKVAEWQNGLFLLRSKKIVESTERWSNPETGRRVRYKSNLLVIEQAKEKLSNAIGKLREMKLGPLSKIHEFITTMEAELQAIDFTIMGKEQEASEWQYQDIASSPEVTVYTTARLIPGSRIGQDRIEKDFNLPIRETK
jgi:hypothetical protein